MITFCIIYELSDANHVEMSQPTNYTKNKCKKLFVTSQFCCNSLPNGSSSSNGS